MATIAFESTASTELNQVRGQGHNPLSPIDDGARVRVKRFSYTATGEVAIDSRIELAELPAGAVVLQTVVDAMSLSNSAEVSVGYTDKSAPVDTNETKLLAATAAAAISAAGESNVQVGTNGIQSIFATTSVGALAADDTLSGRLVYVVNT